MTRQLLSVALSLAVVSQGIARADEAATAAIMVVRDRAALAAHIDSLEAGDRIVVATDDGVIAGEFVEKDDGAMLIDRPLIEGGAERMTIPLKEIQGIRYQTPAVTTRADKIGKTIVIVALLGAGVWLWTTLVRGLGGP
jgi:hypothetical protein